MRSSSACRRSMGLSARRSGRESREALRPARSAAFRAGRSSGGKRSTVARTMPAASNVSTTPSARMRKDCRRAGHAQRVHAIAEGVVGGADAAVAVDLDAPARDMLAFVAARGQAQRRRSENARAARRRARSRGGCGCASSASALQFSRYCSASSAPSRLFSSMNSVTNSCRPDRKRSSMEAFSSRRSTVRAWRCDGPCTP